MAIFLADDKQLQFFVEGMKAVMERLASKADRSDLAVLNKLIENFKIKTEDFTVKTAS